MRIFLIIAGLVTLIAASIKAQHGLVPYWFRFPRPATLTTAGIVPVVRAAGKLPAPRVQITGSNFALGTNVIGGMISGANPVDFSGDNVIFGHNLLGGNVGISANNIVSGQTLITEESFLPDGFTLANLPEPLSIGGPGISHAAATYNAIKDSSSFFVNVVLPFIEVASDTEGDLQTVTAKEGETISITCPPGKYIYRWEAAYTAADLAAAPTCGVYVTYSGQVDSSCAYSSSCSFTVSTENVGVPADPCPGIVKALTINYACYYD